MSADLKKFPSFKNGGLLSVSGIFPFRYSCYYTYKPSSLETLDNFCSKQVENIYPWMSKIFQFIICQYLFKYFTAHIYYNNLTNREFSISQISLFFSPRFPEIQCVSIYYFCFFFVQKDFYVFVFWRIFWMNSFPGGYWTLSFARFWRPLDVHCSTVTSQRLIVFNKTYFAYNTICEWR